MMKKASPCEGATAHPFPVSSPGASKCLWGRMCARSTLISAKTLGMQTAIMGEPTALGMHHALFDHPAVMSCRLVLPCCKRPRLQSGHSQQVLRLPYRQAAQNVFCTACKPEVCTVTTSE